ncbi:MAG: long-chain fatty acid--CoA ligase [Deltaproteobacteria bacterium]|nr:long-chain fatty acid--CoA ligase [Deltaproteobacteria bacterium]
MIGFLRTRFAEDPSKEAIVWNDQVFTYRWMLEKIDFWAGRIAEDGIAAGTVVMLEGDFSPNSVALLLALIEHCCIIVPLTVQNEATKKQFAEIAMAEYVFYVDADDVVSGRGMGRRAEHAYYRQLRDDGHPGLVLFSSGSTGESKAAVHDFVRLFDKFQARRQDMRTLTFLLYDHIGGVDTLFYSLSNASCIVTVQDRKPETVCAAIQKYRVEVLPVSPSFLNLLILSQTYKQFDLSSLNYITYGAEVMPESTLKKCHELFPEVTLLQKFGTTEVGTLRSKSKASDSTWVKIGGEGYELRIRDDMLEIKARSAILGYLNAPSPFTDDGWFMTGDLVEVDGEYMRILGRKKEMINVGGEKVNPAEVENVICEMDTIKEVGVYAEENALLGNIVCAKISLMQPAEDHKEIIKQVKAYCSARLERYKVPVKVVVVDEKLHSDRFKKMRRHLK